MENQIVLKFSDNPSALYTLLKAFRNRKNKHVYGKEVPSIRAVRSGHKIDPKHLKAFYEICGVSPSPYLHILYPFTLMYPYIMRTLCAREMPLSMFKVLNTRNSITQYRGIKPQEILDLECHNSAFRIIPKGLEIDITSEVAVGKEKVWDNTTTYFLPGKFAQSETPYIPPKLEPIDNAPITSEWFLPAKDRFRFARVSGDTNGIHYVSLYARMLGFQRDFAQPIRVVAKCVNCLGEWSVEKPLRLDFTLKGPVYYESKLVLKSLTVYNSSRFDLYREKNDRPCICGILGTL
jgi:hypothetical protein